MGNISITRRGFIEAALGVGTLLVSAPSVALADGLYAAAPGKNHRPPLCLHGRVSNSVVHI